MITYVIFILLGLIIQPWIAFTIAFCAGIIWTLVGTSQFVFKGKLTFQTGLLFVIWYSFLYGIGRIAILIIQPSSLDALVITSLIILIFTTPLTFIGGRLLFGGSAK